MSHSSSQIAAWIRQQAAMAGARGLVVGLRGDLDSAVVVRLCQMAMPGHVIGVIMPCDSDPRPHQRDLASDERDLPSDERDLPSDEDEADAQLVAGQFGVPALRVDVAPAYDRLAVELSSALGNLPPDQRPAASTDARARMNVKPRLRMAALYFVASSLEYLVAGTANRSELMIGCFTKYGDGAADLLPIGRLLRSDVLALGRELQVPDGIIDKAPNAGLRTGRTGEPAMGFSDNDLERYLTKGPDGVAPALAMRIERLVRESEHKRALAPMPD